LPTMAKAGLNWTTGRDGWIGQHADTFGKNGRRFAFNSKADEGTTVRFELPLN